MSPPVASGVPGALDVFGPRTWVAPEVTSRLRLPMRAPVVPHPDADSARSGDPESGPWWRSLDGIWSFRRFDRPEEVSADLVGPDPSPGPDPLGPVPLGGGPWGAIRVPGAWTMQPAGLPDLPAYTNVVMPFGEDPPEVPADNPTGVYRTGFALPPEWEGRRVVLRLGGAESVAYCWVNGHPVGMGKDSRLPSEFDVTEAVSPGSNSLCIVVVRWSDATWLEDQDQWWHAGIHRSVHLYSTSRTWLADVALVPGLRSAGTNRPVGTLDVDVRVGSVERLAPGWTVCVAVETLDGRPLVDTRPAPVPCFEHGDPATELVSGMIFAGNRVVATLEVPGITPWSAEEPQRYRVLVSLTDPQGVDVEVTAQLTGFRSVEVADRELRVNGRAVEIRGVNRHEHNDRWGRTVRVEQTRAELVAMKRWNINAVRCAHAPADEHFYDLCDELGLYVIDEADVETHARQASLCHDPRYQLAIVERGMRMVLRDRNHPCIVQWSLGNESGYGAAHDAMAAWIRRTDPSRPLHYEGPIMFDLAALNPVSDTVAPMYRSIDEIVAWAESGVDRRRPLILCEFSHAMGNSNGNLADYWDAVRATPGLQGGFIWEWVDHGIRIADRPGGPIGAACVDDGPDAEAWHWGYGGDFGEAVHDSNFVADGLVWPDHRPHPAIEEVRRVFQPVTVEPASDRPGWYRVRNWDSFRDLGWLEARWSLTWDGVEVEAGQTELPVVPPGQTGWLRCIPRRRKAPPGVEAHLMLRFVTRAATPWCERAHEVAFAQFALRTTPVSVLRGRPRAPRGVLNGIDMSCTADGGIEAIRVLDRPVVTRGPGLALWRASIDNDGLKTGWMAELAPRLGKWTHWGLDRPEVRHRGNSVVTVEGGLRSTRLSTYRVAGCTRPVEHRQHLYLGPDGVLSCSELITVPSALYDLPRVGVSLEFAPGFEALEWFGTGPHETYPDRRTSARVGRFRSTVSDQYVPYVVPQEHGLHVDTRWLALEDDGAGRGGSPLGVCLVAEGLPAFSAGHYRAADLQEATHTHELEPRAETVVHLDRFHRGLGTGSCGPDTLDAYRSGGGTYRLDYRMIWYRPGEVDPGELARACVTSAARVSCRSCRLW